MKMKKLLLATALLVASTAANAGLVSGAGGVNWNAADVNSTANGGNFFTPLSFRQCQKRLGMIVMCSFCFNNLRPTVLKIPFSSKCDAHNNVPSISSYGTWFGSSYAKG